MLMLIYLFNSFPLILWKLQYHRLSWGAIQFSNNELLFSPYQIKIYILIFPFIMYKPGISKQSMQRQDNLGHLLQEAA